MGDNGEIKKRKLSLNRETVMVLQSNDLEDVHGGTGWGKSIKESVKWSWKSVKWLLSAKEVYDSAKASYDAIKDANGGGGGAPKSRYYRTPGGCAD